MLNNHLYNLMNQLVEESRSLARVSQYLKDAKGCKECAVFWKALKMDKEQHIHDLGALIKKHM